MFLVCGEALFDVFVAERRVDGLTLDARPGGSPFNVALGLARLGQPTELFTGLSADPLGQRLAGFARADSIGVRYVAASGLPTAISLVDLDGDGVPAYAFYGDRRGCAAFSPADLPALGPETRAVHMGSIATVIEPAAAALAALAERESGRRLVSYDPNVRPSIEPDLEIWRERLARLSRACHLVKISADDLELLHPGIAHEEAARRWLSEGVRLAVITRGENGARAWTRSATAEVAGSPAALVDTVGAGDSFQAALLAGLAEIGQVTPAGLDGLGEGQLERLLVFACRAAAITCSRRGADMPRRSEIPDADGPY